MKNKGATENVMKSLLAFTLPLIMSGMFQQLFNWVDAFIVGNVEGELALAGIGATTSLYNLFVTVITGFTSGLAVLAAQYYGRKEKRKITGILAAYAVLLGVCLPLSLWEEFSSARTSCFCSTHRKTFLPARKDTSASCS